MSARSGAGRLGVSYAAVTGHLKLRSTASSKLMGILWSLIMILGSPSFDCLVCVTWIRCSNASKDH